MSRTDFVREWVAALRGGNYKQNFGIMRNQEGNKFCALGVICDLYVKAGFAEWDKTPERWMHLTNIKILCDIPSDLSFAIIDLNDRQNKTFGEIADYIDEYYNSRKLDVQPVSA